MQIKKYYKKSFDVLKNKKILVFLIFSIYILAFISSTVYHANQKQPSEKEVLDAETEKLKQESFKNY